jgi:hypothetical protein
MAISPDPAAATFPIHLSGFTDREACIDAITRAVLGMDMRDPSLIASAYTSDASFELVMRSDLPGHPPSGTFTGAEAIAAEIMRTIGKLDTLHHLTNFRVDIFDGEGGKKEAHMTCYALANHYRPGQGPDMDVKGLMMGNVHDVRLVKGEDGVWKVRKQVLRCQWAEGDGTMFKH